MLAMRETTAPGRTPKPPFDVEVGRQIVVGREDLVKMEEDAPAKQAGEILPEFVTVKTPREPRMDDEVNPLRPPDDVQGAAQRLLRKSAEMFLPVETFLLRRVPNPPFLQDRDGTVVHVGVDTEDDHGVSAIKNHPVQPSLKVLSCNPPVNANPGKEYLENAPGWLMISTTHREPVS